MIPAAQVERPVDDQQEQLAGQQIREHAAGGADEMEAFQSAGNLTILPSAHKLGPRTRPA